MSKPTAVERDMKKISKQKFAGSAFSACCKRKCHRSCCHTALIHSRWESLTVASTRCKNSTPRSLKQFGKSSKWVSKNAIQCKIVRWCSKCFGVFNVTIHVPLHHYYAHVHRLSSVTSATSKNPTKSWSSSSLPLMSLESSWSNRKMALPQASAWRLSRRGRNP